MNQDPEIISEISRYNSPLSHNMRIRGKTGILIFSCQSS